MKISSPIPLYATAEWLVARPKCCHPRLLQSNVKGSHGATTGPLTSFIQVPFAGTTVWSTVYWMCMLTGIIPATINLSGPSMGPFYACQRGGNIAIDTLSNISAVSCSSAPLKAVAFACQGSGVRSQDATCRILHTFFRCWP